MATLYLIRHGAYITLGEGDKLVDDGLSSDGRDQTKKLANYFTEKNFKADVLLSSSLRRASETANLLAPALNLEVNERDDLREWYNLIEGTMTSDEFGKRINDMPASSRLFTPVMEGTERWVDFMVRACSALNDIANTYRGKRVAVVCHGGIIEASFMYFTGMSTVRAPGIIVEPGYTSITSWQLLGNRWKLGVYNYQPHLEPVL